MRSRYGRDRTKFRKKISLWCLLFTIVFLENVFLVWQYFSPVTTHTGTATMTDGNELQTPLFLMSEGVKEKEQLSQKNRRLHRPHPHAGAVDENGRHGYVADTSPSRLTVPTNIDTTTFDAYSDLGVEGEGGRQVLEKIREGLIQSRELIAATSSNKTIPRILCLVYTVDTESSKRNLRSIVQTWASHCDGFLAASNVTDSRLGAVNILHQGPERCVDVCRFVVSKSAPFQIHPFSDCRCHDYSYGNMWQKVRSMWAYAYDNYRDKFDYFHICGDDTYLIVDNLRSYLMGDQIQKLLDGHIDLFASYQARKMRLSKEVQGWKTRRPRPLLLGSPKKFGKQIFPVGGPGYTINRAALKLLVEDALPNFSANLTDSREDLLVAGAFRHFGVVTADTRDREKAWRYHNENAQRMFDFHFKPLKKVAPDLHLGGLAEVSTQSVALHTKTGKKDSILSTTDELNLRYYAVLERGYDTGRGSVYLKL